MNIFILDYDIDLCAQYHVDRHCIKMILETTQLLNNALIANDPAYTPIYRQTHKNHPSTLWTMESKTNFEWLINLGLSLSQEYTYRYKKIHKCHAIIDAFTNRLPYAIFPKNSLTSFKLCMPDEYKVEDTVESYRNYYKGSKRHIAKWKCRSIPVWWK